MSNKVLVSEENLTNIANAIREKNGETTTYKPGDMATAIQNISSGGDPELEASFMSSIDGSLGANITKLPSVITKIGDFSFYNYTNLALTELPSGITSIGSYAFHGCKNLALTELPSGITSIDEYAFYSCENIALTELPSGITSSIGFSTFSNCKNLALTELPSGITSIGTYAFNKCTNLSSLTLKGKVEDISNNAFANCKNLNVIILPNVTKVPTGTSNMFNSTPIASGTGYIYVPDTLVDSFKTATNWSTYADQIKPISELEASA